MRKRKKENMSINEARAYKTKAEGQALLISAWMPLLMLVPLVIIVVVCLCFGIDLMNLKLIGEFLVVGLSNTTKQ